MELILYGTRLGRLSVGWRTEWRMAVDLEQLVLEQLVLEQLVLEQDVCRSWNRQRSLVGL